MTQPIFKTGQLVKVTNCPGLDGQNTGIIRGPMRTGYAVEITGLYFCGTNSRRLVKTETNFIETQDIKPFSE